MTSSVVSSGNLFSVSGLASGIDTATIVDSLIQSDRIPATIIESKRTIAKSHLAALQAMNTKLLALRDSLDPLKQSSTFGAKTAVASNPDAVTVSASSTAVNGSLTFSVDRLASANQWATASGAAGGLGTIHIAIGGGQEVAVVVTSTSLADIADAVNQENAGVTASVINDGHGDRLLFTADDTGEDKAITTLYGDGGLSTLLPGLADAGMTEVTKGQDAKITIGLGLEMTSPTNTFSSAIPGLTLTVNEEAAKVTVTTSQDQGTVASTVKTMVDSFNASISFYKSNNTYNTDTKTAGSLFSDYDLGIQLRSVESSFTKIVSTQPAGYASLKDVGITVGSDGAMTIDQSVFTSKLGKNQKAVSDLFAAVGLAATKQMDGLTQSVNGSMALKTSQLSSSIDDMTERITAIDARLELRRAYYQSKFLAMEQTIAQLQSQGNSMTSQLSSLTSSKSK